MMSNRPSLHWWCQIGAGVKWTPVSNWLFYTRGVKLTLLHSWCQIGPVSNWLRCQIVLQSPETLKGSLRPHSKNPWDHPQRLSETTLKGSLRPGSIMLQPRQLWLEAHSCLRRHIWLVVIRASFANQVDVNDYVFLTQMWKTSSSTLLLVMAHISTAFTWLCTFVANSASLRLHAVWDRGERIVFSGSNTNTIRFKKCGRIRIRLLFGFRNLAEYEYEYYSEGHFCPNTNTNT